MRLALIALSIAVLTLSALLFVKAHPANATGPGPAARVFSHFECYDPNPIGPPPPPPRNVVLLTDQFGQNQTQVGPALLFCTPVMKQLQAGVTGLPVPSPADHLTCYAITGPPVNKRVLAMNQLDRPRLTVDKPQMLCVPTHKKLL